MTAQARLRRLTAAPGVWYALGIAIVIVASAIIGSPESALGMTLALLIVGVLPGSAVAAAVMRRSSVAHVLIVGTIIGLGLLSLGGMLSHLTEVGIVRWIPSVIGATVGALVVWRRRGRGQALERAASRLPRSALVGAALAFVALLPSTAIALISQQVDWVGWVRFSLDVPFQVALAAEVSQHAPTQMPWVAGVELSYPWMYHSAMGVWASAAGVPAVDVVFQGWPVLVVALIPAAIALVAWEITRNRWAASASPLVFVLAHGIIPSDGLLNQLPLLTVSPTRDYAALFILLALLAFSHLLGRPSVRAMSGGWLAVLAIAAFVGAGAKGSSLPVMLGGVLLALFVIIVTRRLRWTSVLTFGVFALASTAGFIAALPVRGPNDAVVFGPMSFLPEDTPARLAVSVVLVVLLAGSSIGAWSIAGRGGLRARTGAALLAGVVLAGIVGLAGLSHPSHSQLYFWQSAQPALAILLAWAAVRLIAERGRVVIVAGALTLLLTATAGSTPAPAWALGVGLAALASIVAIVVVVRTSPTGGLRRNLLVWVGLAGMLVQAAQLVSVPEGRLGGSRSDVSVIGALHSSQRDALQYIDARAGSEELVVSNRHCYRAASTTEDACEGRWFATAAWSERRVLVDGWAYTPYGADPSWVSEQLTLSDGFIQSPSAEELNELRSAGVGWVYVDTRLPHAEELADFAELEFEGEFAQVYRLP